MSLLRVLLLAVIGLLMIATVVIGIGSEGTGLVEKAALLCFGAFLVLASIRVHRMGRPSL